MTSTPYLAPFPPSFADEPWTFGLALFSDLLVSALCGALLLSMAFEALRKRRTLALLGLRGKCDLFPRFSVLNVRRLIVVGFLTTLLFRALPDALWMLAWHETSKGTMDALFLLDWWGDIVGLVTCGLSLALMVWSAQPIDQALAHFSNLPLAPPKWDQARQYVLITVLVTILAAGVTVGKAI